MEGDRKRVSVNFGRILQKLRKEQGLSQKELCRGLCSIPTLSRIESGEREPDQMLFDSLISRLGKDSAKWELILKENDKKLLQKRIYIEYLIQAEDWEELKEKLADYKEFDGVTKNLQEQYVCLIQAILYKQEKQYEAALKCCYEGLDKTKLQIDGKYFRIRERVSRNELQLLCCMGEILYCQEEISELKKYEYWEEILKYIDYFCTDEQYYLEFYIQTNYYLGSIAYQQGQYRECEIYIQSAIKEMKDKKSIFYLEEFLKLIAELKENEVFKEMFFLSKEEIKSLLEVLEEWREKNKNFKEKEKYIRAVNNVCSINEIIKNVRFLLRKTQEEIVGVEINKSVLESRGTQASVSEIERGKRNPIKSTSKYYLKQLGLNGREEKFKLSINGEDFEIQELKEKIDFYISTHDLSKAEEVLYVLKKRISLLDPKNEQYIREIELFIQNENGILSCDEWKKEIFDILSLTIDKKYMDEKIVKRAGEILCTKEELFLLMNLGCAYHRNKEYKRALDVYLILENYFQQFYVLSNRGIYKTLLYNLSQIYGLIGEYEKSIEKSEKCIFMEMLNLKSYSWYRALYNIGWCYEKKMIKEQECEKKREYTEYYYKFLKQSYSLAKFYQDNVIIRAIEDKIK